MFEPQGKVAQHFGARNADGIDASPSKRKIFTDLAPNGGDFYLKQGSLYDTNPNFMHYCKGNPTKVPYICIKFDPKKMG